MKSRHNGRNEMQRESILEAASSLFIEKGFAGTSMHDIAELLGVTRPAIYYYFPNKESILEALTDEITRAASNLTKNILNQNDLAPEELLRELVVKHAMLILTHPIQFRVVERSESGLSEMGRLTAETSRKSVLSNFVQVIKMGSDAGVFQVPNAYTAAFSMIGMCNWTAWWFDGDTHEAIQVAEQIAEFALRSVVKKEQRKFRSTSPRESLQILREQLDILESQLP